MTARILAAVACFAGTVGLYEISLNPAAGPPEGVVRQAPMAMFTSIEYDMDTHTLMLAFTNGYACTYYQVPWSHFRGLEFAQHKGWYYNKHIRGQYPCVRMDADGDR